MCWDHSTHSQETTIATTVKIKSLIDLPTKPTKELSLTLT
jgi:hypothetical protein